MHAYNLQDVDTKTRSLFLDSNMGFSLLLGGGGWVCWWWRVWYAHMWHGVYVVRASKWPMHLLPLFSSSTQQSTY